MSGIKQVLKSWVENIKNNNNKIISYDSQNGQSNTYSQSGEVSATEMAVQISENYFAVLWSMSNFLRLKIGFINVRKLQVPEKNH